MPTTPDLLADLDTAFDAGGARMTLTTLELLERLQATYPDPYRSWTTRMLDDTARQRGVMRCQLPGRDRVGYWHEDIIWAREASNPAGSPGESQERPA